MFLELGLAVGGGILNALAGQEQNAEIEKRKQAAIAALRENIIDPKELDTMLTDINRLFNSRLVNTLNSTAIRSRGVANSGVVKGVVAGQIEGARLGTLSETRFKALESNKQTMNQIANVNASMGRQNSFLGDFASGTLTALPAVLEGSKYFSGQTSADPLKPIETGTKPFQDLPLPNYNESNVGTGLNTFGQLFNNDLPTFDMPNLTFKDYWKQ